MGVQIITGDCRTELAKLADESVDCVITDPPYGTTSLPWDQVVDGWLELLPRVLKQGASVWIFGSMRNLLGLSDEFDGWNIAQDIVWEKHNGSNAFADRFRNVHEHAIQLYHQDQLWKDTFKQPLFSDDARAKVVRRKARPQQWGDIGGSTFRSEDGGPRMMRSVLCARSEHGRALHPTQKPVSLLQALVAYSCPEGGVVLDPFAGSGSTGIAAQSLGRSAVLIEADPSFADVARQRLRDDCPMFAGAAA